MVLLSFLLRRNRTRKFKMNTRCLRTLGSALAVVLSFAFTPCMGDEVSDNRDWSSVNEQAHRVTACSRLQPMLDKDASESFEDFVSGGVRTLRKDRATTEEIRKAMGVLETFCDQLSKKGRNNKQVALDELRASKRNSRYPFPEETINEAEKLAFELGFNFASSLIVLTTGILALTITFRKDLIDASTRAQSERWLKLSWAIYLISMLAGIITMMALIGPLNPRLHNPQSFSFTPSIRVPQVVQLFCFAAGTLFLVLYGSGAWVVDQSTGAEGARVHRKKRAD